MLLGIDNRHALCLKPNGIRRATSAPMSEILDFHEISEFSETDPMAIIGWQARKGGREAEGGGLLNRYTG